MKKLVILAALGVAGLVSAKGNEHATKKLEKEKQNLKAPLQTCGVRMHIIRVVNLWVLKL
ncbi:MAG: hypothetical protein K0R36_336 [Chryseobacterium sp.]|jgi:hypothetical protein|nr:hypothetical protein [Chryseobacterium sp.]